MSEDLTDTTWTVGTVTGKCPDRYDDCWFVDGMHYFRGDLGQRIPGRTGPAEGDQARCVTCEDLSVVGAR